MRRVRVCRRAILLLSLPAWAGPSISQQPPLSLTPTEIVAKGQELMRGAKSSHSTFVMTLLRPSFKRELGIESFHEGRDKSFIIVKKPISEQGSRTLRIKLDIWTYTRKTEQAIKIPSSMMHTAWMGSDFTYEDIVKLDSLTRDYYHTIKEKIPDPAKRSDLLVTLELIPKPNAPVVWGKVIWSAAISADEQEVIPVEEKDFNEREELVRKITLDKIEQLGGKRIPTLLKCEMFNKKKRGSQTTLEYKKIIFDKAIDPSVFTIKTLEQGMN